MKKWADGRIKQRIISALLHDRAQTPVLYAEGDYRDLEVQGACAEHLLGYVRNHGNEALAVVSPRLWARLSDIDDLSLAAANWSDTSMALPQGRWMNVITGEEITVSKGR